MLPPDRDTYVTAFGRGLEVIRCFSGAQPARTIAEVARAAGLNRATARRFIHTLEAEGYVRAENGRYALRPRALELGYAYLSSIAVDEVVQRHLLDLAERLRESCSAGVLDGGDIVFVARAQTSYPRVMTLALTVGARIPAYLTALGRVLLAELPDDQLAGYLRTAELRRNTAHTITDPTRLRQELVAVRAGGYCVMDQEIELGVRAAAVPVHRPGRPALAISVAAHASRESVAAIEANYVPALREAAREIENLPRTRG
jgi:IclR family transcriptional regulator, pca regulon regulatory protein